MSLQQALSIVLFSFFLIHICRSVTCAPTQDCTVTPTPGFPLDKTITCNAGATCSIDCETLFANECLEDRIYCNKGSICHVNCNGVASCKNTLFNATEAKHLTITTNGVSAAETARVYCPSNGAGGDVSCTLQSIDNDSASQYSGIQIYAVEGFHDVSLTCHANNCGKNGGIKLWCGMAIDQECIVNVENDGHYTNCEPTSPFDCANAMLPTYEPTTNQPTTNQPTTNQPTTDQPTTQQPTTANPTTDTPTTIKPTTYLPTTQSPTTMNPTTSIPTTYNPSSFPTQYPSDLSTTLIPTTIEPSISPTFIINENSVATTMESDESIITPKKKDDIGYIYLIIGCVALLILIAIFMYCMKRKKKQKQLHKIEIQLNEERTYNDNKINETNKERNSNQNDVKSVSMDMSNSDNDDDIYKNDSNNMISSGGTTANSEQYILKDNDNDNNEGSDIERLYDNQSDDIMTEGNTIDLNEAEQQQQLKRDGFYVRATTDYIACDEDQLNLKENEIFFIMETVESGWWYGIDENGNDGWIPSNYVEKCNLNEQEELKQQQKQQTDVGDLMGHKRDNYLVNMDKYLNIVLPPRVLPVIAGFGATIGKDEYSDDSDTDNETVGKSTKM